MLNCVVPLSLLHYVLNLLVFVLHCHPLSSRIIVTLFIASVTILLVIDIYEHTTVEITLSKLLLLAADHGSSFIFIEPYLCELFELPYVLGQVYPVAARGLNFWWGWCDFITRGPDSSCSL